MLNWQAFQIVDGAPVQQGSGLAVVHPAPVELACYVDGAEPACAGKISGDLPIIDGTIHIAIGDRALDHIDAVGLINQSIMTKRANACVGKSRLVKQPSYEALPDLARSPGDKDQHALSPSNS